MNEYKAFLPDWFCMVEANTEEEAQRLAAENFRRWLGEEPNRVIVWGERFDITSGAEHGT